MTVTMHSGSLLSEKKRILAWHDTTAVYVGMALFTTGAAVFSLIGIGVALNTSEYGKYAWVPRTLLVLSAVLLVASVSRLCRRIYLRLRDR